MKYDAGSVVTVVTIDPMMLTIEKGTCELRGKLYYTGDIIVIDDSEIINVMTDVEFGLVCPFERSCTTSVDEILLVSE